MGKWITNKDGRKVLNEMYDFCEKCQRLFWGFKCNICGAKNNRIGKVEKKEEKKDD